MTGRCILAALTATATVVMAQTQSEMDDARNAAHDFMTTVAVFRKTEQWETAVDRLERDAKRYTGKSRVQIAMLEREFPNAPADLKRKFVVMTVKLDETAVQAIRFTRAFHKALDSMTPEDAEAAETARIKFINAAKDYAMAALDFTGKNP